MIKTAYSAAIVAMVCMVVALITGSIENGFCFACGAFTTAFVVFLEDM